MVDFQLRIRSVKGADSCFNGGVSFSTSETQGHIKSQFNYSQK